MRSICWFLKCKYSTMAGFRPRMWCHWTYSWEEMHTVSWLLHTAELTSSIEGPEFYSLDFFFFKPAWIFLILNSIPVFTFVLCFFVFFFQLALLMYDLCTVKFSNFRCAVWVLTYVYFHHNHDTLLPLLYTVARLIFPEPCFARTTHLCIKPSRPCTVHRIKYSLLWSGSLPSSCLLLWPYWLLPG